MEELIFKFNKSFLYVFSIFIKWVFTFKKNKGNLIKINKDNINSHKNHFLTYIILMALLKGPFQSG